MERLHLGGKLKKTMNTLKPGAKLKAGVARSAGYCSERFALKVRWGVLGTHNYL